MCQFVLHSNTAKICSWFGTRSVEYRFLFSGHIKNMGMRLKWYIQLPSIYMYMYMQCEKLPKGDKTGNCQNKVGWSRTWLKGKTEQKTKMVKIMPRPREMWRHTRNRHCESWKSVRLENGSVKLPARASNVHYHLQMECLKLADPKFNPLLLVVPEEVKLWT